MATQSTMESVRDRVELPEQTPFDGRQGLPQVVGRVLDDLGEQLASPYADYAPAFALEVEKEGVWWITDHGTRIALLHTIDDSLDLFEFVPGKPRLKAVEMPKLYHAPSLLGARITTTQRLNSFYRSSDEINVDLQNVDDAVTITVTEAWNNPEMHSRKRFVVCVDPRFGYIVHTTNEVIGDSPVGIEFANFLAAGLSDTRPGKDRFPYVLWHHPEKGPLKWRSNIVSLRTPGQLPPQGLRAIASDGWLGFFGETDWNPVFAMTSANGRLESATCDNLLDEHLRFADAPPQDDAGHYIRQCEGTLFSCPVELSNRLIERTPTNNLGMESLPQNHHLQVAPFEIDTTTDFENTVPLEVYYRGAYWPASKDGKGIAWLTEQKAHSGGWSMRLMCDDGNEELTLHPVGSSLWLNEGKRYRLSAWFHHSGEGSAQVRMTARQIYMTWADRAAEDEDSLKLSNTGDWIRLEVEFTALVNDPAILIGLHWAGSGELFVDDVLLEQLAD